MPRTIVTYTTIDRLSETVPAPYRSAVTQLFTKLTRNEPSFNKTTPFNIENIRLILGDFEYNWVKNNARCHVVMDEISDDLKSMAVPTPQSKTVIETKRPSENNEFQKAQELLDTKTQHLIKGKSELQFRQGRIENFDFHAFENPTDGSMQVTLQINLGTKNLENLKDYHKARKEVDSLHNQEGNSAYDTFLHNLELGLVTITFPKA